MKTFCKDGGKISIVKREEIRISKRLKKNNWKIVFHFETSFLLSNGLNFIK